MIKRTVIFIHLKIFLINVSIFETNYKLIIFLERNSNENISYFKGKSLVLLAGIVQT